MEESKSIQENVSEEENNNQVSSSNEVNNTVQNKPPVKNNNGLVITLVTIIILLAAALVYFIFFNKEEKEKNTLKPTTPTPTASQIIDETPEPTPNSTPVGRELLIYVSEDSGTLMYGDDISSSAKPAYQIKVTKEDAKIIALDEWSVRFVLYKDDAIYLYDTKTQKSTKLNLEDNYKEYHMYFNETEDKIVGIGYLKDNNSLGYYNVSLNKKLYDGKYKVNKYDYVSYTLNQLTDNVLLVKAEDAAYILKANQEKVLLKRNYEIKDQDLSFYQFMAFNSNGKYIYTEGMCVTEYCGIDVIYSENFQEIYKPSSQIDMNLMSFENGYIYFAENDEKLSHIKKIDLNGKLLLDGQTTDTLYMIKKNYVVYRNDDTIYIENLDNSEEVKEIVQLINGWSFSEYDSGYYSRTQLDRMDEKNKAEGIYVVVEYGTDQDGNPMKEANGYYGMEYCYTPDKKIITYPIKEAMGGRAKPVLYLYPTKETRVNVKFEKPYLLTTTYPKYINTWNVTVKPNGDMYDNDGKYYYALYWDEKRCNEVPFNEGFYVEGKDAIKFLEEKLTYIGLSDKERNEFIMYWLPVMERNEKNLVYFELTRERENGNKLIIEPKPDSLLRVSIHIKKVNKRVNIVEQKLETFKRVGFTAVEWGGMTY